MAKQAAARKLDDAPVFNPEHPHGEVFSSDPNKQRARYYQNGHYFAGNKEYLSSEPNAKPIPLAGAAKPQAPAVEVRSISEDELEDYLADPRAEKLVNLPYDTLSKMVAEAGGPAFSGDNALKFYAAWLIKFTV